MTGNVLHVSTGHQSVHSRLHQEQPRDRQCQDGSRAGNLRSPWQALLSLSSEDRVPEFASSMSSHACTSVHPADAQTVFINVATIATHKAVSEHVVKSVTGSYIHSFIIALQMQLVNMHLNFNSHPVIFSNSVILGNKSILSPFKPQKNFLLHVASWVRSPFPYSIPECCHLSCEYQIAFFCMRVKMIQNIRTPHSVSDFSLATCPGTPYHASPMTTYNSCLLDVHSCLPSTLLS